MRARTAVPALAVLACGLGLVPFAPTASASTAPSVSAGVVPGSVTPDKDPFYAAPANIASIAPGQIVRSRPVKSTLSGIDLPVTASQISYRSNDSHGKAMLAVTTLVVPKAAWTGPGARPVVSSQSPEDSIGLKCSPSYLYASGNDVQDVALNSAFIDKGWAVAIPDFEGPKSLFLVGPESAHAVLGGIRAVKHFKGAPGIGAANPWALNGYSGGAAATGWAAQLQPSYAPELRLRGTAVGGTPADPAVTARYIDGGVFSGFEFAVAYSLALEFPEAGITGLLNDRGRADFATGSTGLCITEILSTFRNRKLSEDVTVPDPLVVPSVAAVLRLDTIGANGLAPASTNAVYDYHAIPDEIVPVGQDDTMVRNWCKGGAVVQTHRDLFAEHTLELVVQQNDVVRFLSARFAGTTQPVNNCPPYGDGVMTAVRQVPQSGAFQFLRHAGA